jgi:hypothetical protein
MLYPTGAGEARELKWARLEMVLGVGFFADSSSLYVCGTEPGKAPRCYRGPLDASTLEPVTPDSVMGGLSPDGKAVLYERDRALWIHPLPSGPPRRVTELDRRTIVLRPSPDGTSLWVVGNNGNGPDVHVERLDIVNGRRSPVMDLEMPSVRPMMEIGRLTLADDPRVYAYSVSANTSLIFEIRGR